MDNPAPDGVRESTPRDTNMTLSRYLIAGVLLIACGAPAFAQEKLPDGTKVAKVEVRPAKIELNGPFAYSQILVVATLDNGESMDATRIAQFAVKRELASVLNGLVRPVSDGSDDITVSLGGQSMK